MKSKETIYSLISKTLSFDGKIVINGVPGVDKLNYIYNYCSRHNKKYVYFDCEYDIETLTRIKEISGSESFVEDFRKLCEVMDIRMLETVLIFDNIECSDIFCNFLYEFLLKKQFTLVMTIRTRNKLVKNILDDTEIINIAPMSFHECLKKIKQEKYSEMITNHTLMGLPITDMFSDDITEECESYMYYGGIPESVITYASKIKGYDEKIRLIQDRYRYYALEKMMEYSDLDDRDKIRCRMVVDGLLRQMLLTDYHRYTFTEVKEGTTLRDYKKAIDYLCENNYLYKVPHYKNERLFLLFFYDCGILFNSLLQLSNKLKIHNSFDKILFMTKRNYCVTELRREGIDVYFWHSRSEAYIDLVFECNDKTYACQLMNDRELRSRSLDAFIQNFPSAVPLVVCDEKLGCTDRKIIFPFYSISSIKLLNAEDLLTKYRK